MIRGMIARGDIVELDLESAAYEGSTVGRADNLVVFVPYGVPGDRVRALVRRKRRKYAEAVIEEVLEPSQSRVAPRCAHFGTCGGCNWQNVDYERQLAFKRQQVVDLLERVGGISDPPVESTLAAPEPFGYRNKMEFTFGARRWVSREEIESGRKLSRDFALGMHIPKRFDRILDLTECYLQADPSREIVNRVRRLALEHQWSAYNTRAHSGFLRNLVLRTGSNTGQWMVNLVTSRSEPERMELFSEALLGEFAGLTTLINSVNAGRSPVAAGEPVVLHGPGHISERLGSLEFQIGPTSFFQPNTRQAERLFEIIRDCAELRSRQTVYDLYCGLGAISLFVAPGVAHVVGIEAHPDSVRDARANASANGIDNCRFVTGDVRDALSSELITREGMPDVVIADPPRAGMHGDLCRRLIELRPRRIVYTSCNPATQARDLALLAGSYELERVRPVDMFPQTYHIEAVASLRLRA